MVSLIFSENHYTYVIAYLFWIKASPLKQTKNAHEEIYRDAFIFGWWSSFLLLLLLFFWKVRFDFQDEFLALFDI